MPLVAGQLSRGLPSIPCEGKISGICFPLDRVANFAYFCGSLAASSPIGGINVTRRVGFRAEQ